MPYQGRPTILSSHGGYIYWEQIYNKRVSRELQDERDSEKDSEAVGRTREKSPWIIIGTSQLYL